MNTESFTQGLKNSHTKEWSLTQKRRPHLPTQLPQQKHRQPHHCRPIPFQSLDEQLSPPVDLKTAGAAFPEFGCYPLIFFLWRERPEMNSIAGKAGPFS